MNRLQLVSSAAVLLFSQAVYAQTIVLDESNGAVFDGILDGFPGLADQNGTPDFGGNQLAVGLRVGSTEERGVGEYPLAALGDTDADSISSAVLNFNIDDVLTTFGPGTEFTGKASMEILVHPFAGNGVVDVADFLEVQRSTYLVDTTVFGVIDDASLQVSGPLFFEVDITEDLRDIVREGSTSVGIVWRTMDTPTGTSLDNLGNGSAGPPGVGGSVMPYIEVSLSAPATATAPPEPTATPTAPATATQVATASPTPTFTVTPTRPEGSCIGDCNQDRQVGVNELVTAVNIAIGRTPLDACDAADFDEGGTVTVNELVQAVRAALEGCS